MLYTLLVQNIILGGLGLLAHWARRNKGALYTLYGLLGFQGLLLLLASLLFGLGVILFPLVGHKAQITAQMQAQILPLFLMALAAFLATVLSLIPAFRRFLSRHSNIQPSSMPHLLGLCVISVYIPLMLGQIFLLYDPKAMAELIGQLPMLWTLVLSAIGFFWIAFCSVGLWVSRSLPEALARLGLQRLTGRQVLISMSISVGLYGVMALLEHQLGQWSPSSMKDLQTILGSMRLSGTGPVFIAQCVLASLCSGLSEEMLFRGLLQPVFGIFLSAVLFMLLHVQYGPSPGLLIVLLLAIILGVIRQKMNTTASFITHATYNLIGFLMMGMAHGS